MDFPTTAIDIYIYLIWDVDVALGERSIAEAGDDGGEGPR